MGILRRSCIRLCIAVRWHWPGTYSGDTWGGGYCPSWRYNDAYSRDFISVILTWPVAGFLGAHLLSELPGGFKETARSFEDNRADLQAIIGPRQFRELIKALGHADREMRAGAANTLGKLGDKRAIEALLPLLKGHGIDLVVMEALADIGISDTRVIEAILSVLADDVDHINKYVAIKVLSRIGDERCYEPALQVLTDPDYDLSMRCAAIHVLGHLQDTRAVPVLVNLLDHCKFTDDNKNNEGIRMAAAHALCQIGDAAAVDSLLTFLNHALEKGHYLGPLLVDVTVFDDTRIGDILTRARKIEVENHSFWAGRALDALDKKA